MKTFIIVVLGSVLVVVLWFTGNMIGRAERIVKDRPQEMNRLLKENVALKEEIRKVSAEKETLVKEVKDLEGSCKALSNPNQKAITFFDLLKEGK